MAETAAPDALWTSAEAAIATGGRAVGRWTAGGVAIDSRALSPGDLFVALVAARDGHEFTPAAYEAGAAAALVSRAVDGGPHLIVQDTLDGLRKLAVAARDRSPAIRVAVTGSVGKTGVKDALAEAFAVAGRSHKSVLSHNNHWGAPLSLARMPRATERAVFELGMNHAREIAPLTALVRPHVAVITKIAPAHLENLGSMEAIADAKAEIFEGFEELEDWGAAVIPGDDDFALRLAERAGAAGAGWLVRFGTDRAAEARLLAFDLETDAARGEAEIFGRKVAFRLPFAAPHWGLNATAVLAAAYLSQVDLQAAAEGLARYSPGAGRGRPVRLARPGGDAVLIDDSYNANPASVAAALEALAVQPKGTGRRILALGEMLELGPDSDALHAALVDDIERAAIDLVYGVGRGTRALIDALPASRRGDWAEKAGDIAEKVAGAVEAGDVILVKGSNSSRMSVVVERLQSLAV